MSNKRSFLSAAASVVPVPFTDIATDVVLLKQIMPGISEKFGLSKEQIDEYNPQIAIFIYDAAKRLGANMIGKYVTKELIIQILKKRIQFCDEFCGIARKMCEFLSAGMGSENYCK